MPHFDAGDAELFYELGGVAASEATEPPETIVFVNGLTMDTAAWEAVETGFADRYRTLRYDCRGQGRSGKPEGPYRPEQHAADLLALLDGLGLEGLHLLGHSNGGLISVLLAGDAAPGRILSLTLVDSFIRVDAMFSSILASWKGALRAGGPALRFDVATPWVWGASFIERHGKVLASYRDKAAQADPEVIGWLIDGVAGFGNAHKSLRAYEGPVLAAVGQEDILTPLRYSHEIVEWARRGILVTIDHAGHAAPIERPEAVVRVVRGFIERREAFMTPLWPDGDDGEGAEGSG